MKRLTGFEVLTFDCYGTLIDWERGLLTALAPLTCRLESATGADQVLEAFARAESAQEAETPGVAYPGILSRVYRRLAEEWSLETGGEECDRFGASVGEWPAFPDSPAALEILKRHYKLVVLSNIDRRSFAASAHRLGIEFDAVYTAQDIGSYKPDPANFDYLIRHVESDLGIARTGILHTAQSLFHDHVPAQAAGLSTCWIDRRHDKEGWGATAAPVAGMETDFRFRSLGEMAEAVAEEKGQPAI